MPDAESREVPAQLLLGDLEPGPASARIVERSQRWRTTHALRQLALWWALIPLVVFIPPHLPWVVSVFAIGAIRGYGRYSQKRTLLGLHGICPKCGLEQDFRETGRLRDPHTVTCARCHWQLRLRLRSPAGEAPSTP